MRKLKLSLLNKWELDKNYSVVLSSAMLHDGRAFVLTSEKEALIATVCLKYRLWVLRR